MANIIRNVVHAVEDTVDQLGQYARQEADNLTHKAGTRGGGAHVEPL